jgi:N-6 DNA Methylase
MAFDTHDYVPPEREWLLLTGQTGLVFAPRVMTDRQLIPEPQTAADNAAVSTFLDETDRLTDPWEFCQEVLGWPADRVLGAAGQAPLPDGLGLRLTEHDTLLEPHWGIQDRNGDWQVWVRVEAEGIGPDQRGALSGWEATPAQRFERLLRERQVPAGLLITDHEIRLIHAPRGETSGWINWRPADLTTTAGRPMLGGLKMVLGRYRLFAAPVEEGLPALLKESRRAQEMVSTALAQQVLGALHELLRGYVAAEPEAARALAERDPHHLYEGLLTVLMRLVFVLYAEDRSLLPSSADGELRALYEQNYSVRGLLDQLDADAALYPDTMDDRIGGWGRMLALFRLIHGGKGDWIAARGGKLFDPDVFLFLEGRAGAGDAASVMRISDGCLYRVLSGLMRLDGERLSYRTLDVEQIGSVYETVMGFTVEAASGPSLAIKAGKNNKTPVFVSLETLAGLKAEARIKALKDDYSRAALTTKLADAVKKAEGAEGLRDALLPLVDERGSPGGQTVPTGTPVLQPTDERRRSGSHYTPRSLTEPIVRHALAPAFQRLGNRPTPEQVLALKVCDPAMGSGAFLVEACRQIGEKLEAAYQAHGVPSDIPTDEDLALYAKRRVAQVCIYGVDRNPMATDLARLSMWLLTLARDHEFAFLDHALKTGDSLVGLSLKQIEAAHWDQTKPGHAVLRTIVRDKVREALTAREAVRNAPEDTRAIEQARRNRVAEAAAATLRDIGDGVVAAFFAGDKNKAREEKRIEVEQAAASGGRERWDRMAAVGVALRRGEHGVVPFHWALEFPEVFAGDQAGFDAIVGNPPFAGKNTIIKGNRANYLPWLQILHSGAHGNADLVAHFFRRAFGLLKSGGVMGLIATNTIGQGDTRASGLTWILQNGGAISRARRRVKWPGEAAVVVSVLHVVNGEAEAPELEGRLARRISAFLVEGDLDLSPEPLAANSGKAFQGSIVLGMGFTFDDAAAAKGDAEGLATMRALIEKDPRNAERIFPYLGGDEVNTSPTHAPNRYVIDFADFPLRREGDGVWSTMTALQREDALRSGIVPSDYPEPVAADWPDLLEIVERLVKPERLKQKDKGGKDLWWRFLRRRDRLYKTIAPLQKVQAILFTAHFHSVSSLTTDVVFANSLNLFAYEGLGAFALLGCRAHETWARFFGSTMEERLRYTPSDCFRTFPFPVSHETDLDLEAAGQNYYVHRAGLMVLRNEGLTKTYNRFHDRQDRGPDIQRLRELHSEMDRAVLLAYARGETDGAKAAIWRDLAKRAMPEFIDQEADEGKTAKTRLDWPQAFKDEVLGRLLDLNAERAAAEKAAGLFATSGDDIDEGDE